MTLRFAEVVLIRIRFHERPGWKVRPAVVLFDAGDDDFVAAPITSRPRLSSLDLALVDWREAGLNAASTVRAHKPVVSSKADILRRLGVLPEGDSERLRAVLRKVFCERTAESQSVQTSRVR